MVRLGWLCLAACGRIGFGPVGGTGGSGGSGGDASFGGNGDGGTDQGGSRLQLTWYDYGDGTRQITGVYDTQLGLSCTFALDRDGNTYCTPRLGTVVYSDAACTQPILRDTFATCGPEVAGYFGDLTTLSACDDTFGRIYARGAAINPGSYYASFQGTCNTTPTPASASEAYFATGPVVTTAATFVRGAEITAATTGRLAVSGWSTADGLTIATSIHDSALATRCLPEMFGTAAGCVPDTAAGAGWFRDSACSQPARDVPSGCAPPTYASWWTVGTCFDNVPNLGTVGASVGTSLFVYDITNSQCNAGTGTAGYDYYAISAAATQIAPLAYGPEASAQRIQIESWSGVGASLPDRTQVYDTALAMICTPKLASDGVVRCLPSQAGVTTTVYSDSACTVPVTITNSVTSSGCVAQAPTYATANVACNAPTPVYAVGSKITTPLYWTFFSCSTYPLTAYSVGAEVPPSTFITATAGHGP